MVTSHESIARRLSLLLAQRSNLLVQGKRIPASLDAEILRLEQHNALAAPAATDAGMTTGSRVLYALSAALVILTVATYFL